MRPVFLLLLLAAAHLCAQEPLTRIADIRELSPAAAAEKRPVRFEATVTLYDPEVGSFFVSDGEHGIFIAIDLKNRPSPAPRPGDRLRIEGHTQAGDFLPNIALKGMERLGSGPPMSPRKISPAELQSPQLDCAWVEFRAVIKGTYVDRFGALYFDILADGWRLRAYLSRVEKFKTPPWQLLERTMRVQCVLGTRFNQQRQMCGRQLMLPGLSFLLPVEPEPELQAGPLRRSTELLLVTSPVRENVRLRGVVTMLRPGLGFNMRDESGGVLVQTAQPLDFAVGDVVEAQGYAEMADFRPKLNAVEARRLQPGPAPSPVPLDAAATRHSREQQELVFLEARLVEILHSSAFTALRCTAAGGRSFEALLPAKTPLDLAPDSTLRLAGICEILSSDISARTQVADTFQLRLRSPADVAVLARPSWWNARRLGWLAAAITGVAALVGLWAVVLREQVRAQSAIIRDQTERTATLDERQRIARELHDTLEQDLMGVTMLLEDTAEHLTGAGPKAGERLAIARRLLRRSREESRSTIRDLRSVALEQLGLPAAIEETLQPIASAAGIDYAFTIEGRVRKLSVLAETSILRIAHEGASNAVKHAQARQLRVRLEFAAQEVRLEVSDDGDGFAPGEVDARAGHFGLQGIRERANKLGGTIRIASQPGQGTTLRVTIPAPIAASV